MAEHLPSWRFPRVGEGRWWVTLSVPISPVITTLSSTGSTRPSMAFPPMSDGVNATRGTAAVPKGEVAHSCGHSSSTSLRLEVRHHRFGAFKMHELTHVVFRPMVERGRRKHVRRSLTNQLPFVDSMGELRPLLLSDS